MATKTVNFEVSSTVSQYTLAVGNRDVPIANNRGSLKLEVRPEEYTLRWWMSGNQLKGIEVIGKAGNDEVIKVKSRIPANRFEGAGHKRFEVLL